MSALALYVHVKVDSAYRRCGLTAGVRRAVSAALLQTDFRDPAELSVVLTGDAQLQAMNRQYRGLDRPTDVLAFGGGGFCDGRRLASPAHISGSTPFYLGDIVVSMERCAEQARRGRHSPDAELALLVVHGTLHLLGYDHDTRRRKRIMWAAQAEALRWLGLNIQPPEV